MHSDADYFPGYSHLKERSQDSVFRLGSLEFEWDTVKAESNLRRHGVSFEQAAPAFFDERALYLYDPDSSEEEMRWILLGVPSSRSFSASRTRSARAEDTRHQRTAGNAAREERL